MRHIAAKMTQPAARRRAALRNTGARVNLNCERNCRLLIYQGQSRSSVTGGVAARWLNLFSQHAFDGALELAVLGGVDERVDAAVGEHQHDAEMVEPSGEVDDVVDGIHEEERLGHRPAHDESAADHQ